MDNVMKNTSNSNKSAMEIDIDYKHEIIGNNTKNNYDRAKNENLSKKNKTDSESMKKINKTNENKKEKKIHYRGTMNNARGIPPLPNWSNRFSSIVIKSNLLLLSNNYIVNIDLKKKEFIQLIHSSLNIYFENKFSVICQIKDLSNQHDDNSYMFIALDTNGNICFFDKIKDNTQNQLRKNFISSYNENSINNQNQYTYFKEERYVEKIGRSSGIKTILNINLKNFYFKEKNIEYADKDINLNLILVGDNDGNLKILKYFYDAKEKTMKMDNDAFNSIKISKGVCSDIRYIPQKAMIVLSTSSGEIQFYSLIRKQNSDVRKNTDNETLNIKKNDLLILTHVYDSSLNYIYSLDYFLSNNFDQINLSILDKNGSFALVSINFEDIYIHKETKLFLENDFYKDNFFTNPDDLVNLRFLNNKFSFKILDKNRFNNKSIQDQYLFFTNKFIFKQNNPYNIEIYYSSNKGKIYFTTIDLQGSLLSQKIFDQKLFYQEIPENPHNKNIFSITNYNHDRLIFLSADGVISLFNHITKFFEMDVKTIKFRPSSFVESSNKNKYMFFYDEGSNLIKYNHKKLNNGLQAIVRNPLKIKNIEERNYPNLKNSQNYGKKEIKNFLKIKSCIQSNFNENIFALLEYNYIFNSYSISVYDFGSDTRIYRKDLLFKVKSMKFAFERKFDNIEYIINNRDDLKKAQNRQLNNLDNVLNEFCLKEDSESYSNEESISSELVNSNNIDLELENKKNIFTNNEIINYAHLDIECRLENDSYQIKNNDLILDLNENENFIDTHNLQINSSINKMIDENDRKIVKKLKGNKKTKSQTLFNNFDEKKFMFAEKFKQTVQQLFNENNTYELLHIIDEDNNYIIIDYLNNQTNTRKLNNTIFSKIKTKKNNNQISINYDSINKKENPNNVIDKNVLNISKSKTKSKKILLIPFINTGTISKINLCVTNSSEDFLLIKYENGHLKFGIINQIDDFYFGNINLIDNSISINYIFNSGRKIKDDYDLDSNCFIKSDYKNLIKKFSMDVINFRDKPNNSILSDKSCNKLVLVTLENEYNIRIVTINDYILDVLSKYNIFDNYEQYKKRNFELDSYLKKNFLFKSTQKENMINYGNVKAESYLFENNKNLNNNLFSQKIFKNFSNVPAIELKVFNNENNDKNNLKINIIASLVDNTIKYFELIIDNHDFLDIDKSYLNLKYSINAHIAKIQDITFISETNFASISSDQSLKIWDVNKCKLIDLPILNINQNIEKFTKSKNLKEVMNNKNLDSNNLQKDKKNSTKIFPVFTKIVNEAIFSQSYASSNDFINNFTNFYEKLKEKKNSINQNNDLNDLKIYEKEKIIEDLYLEFLPNINQPIGSFDKKYLDYLIFTFCEIKLVNKNMSYFLIKYELMKNFNENMKINSKNMQSLFCLAVYLFIFSSDNISEDIQQIFLKIKIKIQSAMAESDTKNILIEDNNNNIQNENNPKFYSNLINKVNAIIDYFNVEVKIITENKTINMCERRGEKLLELNKKIFCDVPLRAKYFEHIINKEYKEADFMLEENELYFENLILEKIIDNSEKNLSIKIEMDYFKFREKLNKFRAYIYSKQIYQAQKCQAVINVLNDFYISN